MMFGEFGAVWLNGADVGLWASWCWDREEERPGLILDRSVRMRKRLAYTIFQKALALVT